MIPDFSQTSTKKNLQITDDLVHRSGLVYDTGPNEGNVGSLN